MKGKLITFEGLDGAGKTTQLRKLLRYYCERGAALAHTREPGGWPASEKIRSILLDPEMDVCPAAEMYLHAAARAQHVTRVIRPLLKAGFVVLCDRFIDSSLAYQGWGRELGADAVLAANREALQGIMPDLTLLFECEDETRRVAERGRTDRMEREDDDFRRRVRMGYRDLADRRYPDRIVRIDSSAGEEATFRQVLAATNALFAEKLREDL